MDNTNPTQAFARFDENTIEAEAKLLPAELQEPYRWLKTFTREECNRDLDLLIIRFREVGVYNDKTTWSKILRGRWNRDSKDRETASPVISAENLSRAVEALRNNVRVEALRGKVPFVATTTFQAIYDYILARCATDRVNRFGMIIGPTGAQKTACYKEIVRRRNHGTTRWMEAPENGAIGELIGGMAGSFGFSRRTSTPQLRARVSEAVRPHHCIIIDNAQDLWRAKDVKQPALSFLRRLQDETGCVLILSITPTFERELMDGLIQGYFEQFEGRSGGRKKWLRLQDFAPEDDVIAIAKAFELREPRKHLKELVRIAREPGRIRRLFEDLQEGKLLANADEQPFTIEHVREARGDD